MHKYTKFEQSELRRLYELGQSMNFDKLTKIELKAKAHQFLEELRLSDAFTELRMNNATVKHLYRNALSHEQLHDRPKILNDFRLLLTNLYIFKDK